MPYEERPRDSLGRFARPLRYDKMIGVKLNSNEHVYLEKMAKRRKTKPATIARRALMKEIYIDKAKRKKKQEEAVADDNES